MCLTFSKFGRHGRLGNQLFQYAACIGFAVKYQTPLSLPDWEYAEYFETEFPAYRLPENPKTAKEHAFHYTPELYDKLDWQGTDIDLLGYFQSEKYWQHCPQVVRKYLRFKPALIEKVRKPWQKVFEKPVIGIGIRRGDYVGNDHYATLPPTYYILALEQHFPGWQEDYNLLFFSDDPDYCRVQFGGLPNAHFPSGTDIGDLCLFAQCQHFILANSSFSWWAAYLGEKEGSKVVRPHCHFGPASKDKDIKDLYPERWLSFDHTGKKIPLKDITFTIPLRYDHPDRKANLDLCLSMLFAYFDTNVIIGEQGTDKFGYTAGPCEYLKFDCPEFHRTAMLNDMCRAVRTPYVANYDCDVVFPPVQIFLAVDKLRKGADITSPYQGWFAGVPREKWYKRLAETLDVGIFGETKFRGKGINPNSGDAYGGAVFANVESYKWAGMENEKFVSWSAEDQERWARFKTLGLKVERAGGFLYHIEHYRTPNSDTRNPHWKAGEQEYRKVRGMNKQELLEYIKTWQWLK